MHAKKSKTLTHNTRIHIASISFMLVVMGVLVASGTLLSIDTAFTNYKFKSLRTAPSPDTVIVAIDTKSLQQLRKWPWPRNIYGDAVTNIHAAGAKAIAFDVDFSSHRDPITDNAFAEAIKNSGANVYLASFQQPLSRDYPDIMTEMTPYSALRDVAHLASVNFTPDNKGYVHVAQNGHLFSSWIMPSFATALTGNTPNLDSYYLNYAIDIDQIPVISFVDILNGTVNPDHLQDKTVFIGATAIELGDEYTLPSYGIRSGVKLNALAYETVHQGRQLMAIPDYFLLPLALGIGIFLTSIYLRYKIEKYILCSIAIFVICIGVSYILQLAGHILFPIASIWAIQILSMITIAYTELEKRQWKIYSARMELNQNYTLLRALISEQHEGILTIDHHSKVTLINARACTLLGVKHDDVMGQSLWEVCPNMFVPIEATPSDSEGVLDRFELQVPKQGDIEEGDLEEGETTFLDITISRVRTQPEKNKYERRKRPRTTVLFAMHDITALKAAEIKERTAKEVIAESLEAKSLLISTLSHELRTPLNAIIGFSQLYKDQSFGPLGGEEYVEYAGLINQSGHRLLHVVNDMLMAGRIQSKEMTISPRKIRLNDLICNVESKAAAKQPVDVQPILQRVDKDHTVLLDPECMEICLVHLIDNAFKFAGPDAEISLEIYHTDLELCIAVSDTGPGAEVEDMSLLTELLKQGDSSLNRNHEGCGMGLYLVDQLVTLQGAQLDLASSPEGFRAIIKFKLDTIMPLQSHAA